MTLSAIYLQHVCQVSQGHHTTESESGHLRRARAARKAMTETSQDSLSLGFRVQGLGFRAFCSHPCRKRLRGKGQSDGTLAQVQVESADDLGRAIELQPNRNAKYPTTSPLDGDPTATASVMSFLSRSKSIWMKPRVLTSSIMVLTSFAATRKSTQRDGKPALMWVVATVVPATSSGTQETVLLLTKFEEGGR